MRFVCLGYGQEEDWEGMSQGEQDAAIEECFTYDDELRTNGHLADGGQALKSAPTAKTLRWMSGKVLVTDRPFAETKEQLGGIGVLEARDMDHAIKLLLDHPSLRFGVATEIRPVDEDVQMPASNAEYHMQRADSPNSKAGTMKFACLGYLKEESWDAISKKELDARIGQCIAFDEARRKDGQWLGGIKLQSVRTAKTLRSKTGKVLITDGPYAETKEQLGGVVVLGLKDLNHAVELLSTHPSLRLGISIEIRPIDEEINARWEARSKRIESVT